MLTALSHRPNLVQSYETEHYFFDAWRSLRARLELHYRFVKVLQGISLGKSPACHLRLLDQGETFMYHTLEYLTERS